MTTTTTPEFEALSARMDGLEMRLAYQTEAIEDLNGTITAQWKQIDALTRQITMLEDRVAETESRAGTGLDAADEPPPPHY